MLARGKGPSAARETADVCCLSTWALVGLTYHTLMQAGLRRARVCPIPRWLFGCSLRLGQASSFVFLYSFCTCATR